MKKDNKTCISAKPDTLQVHSFNEADDISDQLPMKQKKGAKGVSNYPFSFYEKKVTKRKFDSVYSDKIQIAISGTDHTVTTADKFYIENK